MQGGTVLSVIQKSRHKKELVKLNDRKNRPFLHPANSHVRILHLRKVRNWPIIMGINEIWS